MYGLSGFGDKLKILNCVILTGNYVHYTYGMSGFAGKLKIWNSVNSMGNCVQ